MFRKMNYQKIGEQITTLMKINVQIEILREQKNRLKSKTISEISSELKSNRNQLCAQILRLLTDALECEDFPSSLQFLIDNVKYINPSRSEALTSVNMEATANKVKFLKQLEGKVKSLEIPTIDDLEDHLTKYDLYFIIDSRYYKLTKNKWDTIDNQYNPDHFINYFLPVVLDFTFICDIWFISQYTEKYPNLKIIFNPMIMSRYLQICIFLVSENQSLVELYNNFPEKYDWKAQNMIISRELMDKLIKNRDIHPQMDIRNFISIMKLYLNPYKSRCQEYIMKWVANHSDYTRILNSIHGTEWEITGMAHRIKFIMLIQRLCNSPIDQEFMDMIVDYPLSNNTQRTLIIEFKDNMRISINLDTTVKILQHPEFTLDLNLENFKEILQNYQISKEFVKLKLH